MRELGRLFLKKWRMGTEFPPTRLSLKRNSRNSAAGYLPQRSGEAVMGFGKGALLWLIGLPLPIILLLALFMHHR